MKKNKSIITNDAKELAVALGLNSSIGLEFEIRNNLIDKIILTVKNRNLTHLEVSKLSGASRTRITALMNRQSKGISIDLMLRILSSIGVQAKLQFKKKVA